MSLIIQDHYLIQSDNYTLTLIGYVGEIRD